MPSSLGFLEAILKLLSPISQGLTPLHIASREGHIEVVSCLINKAAMLLHVEDNKRHTSLHTAAANGHRDLCAVLIGQGADLNVQDEVSDENSLIILSLWTIYFHVLFSSILPSFSFSCLFVFFKN